MEKQQRKLSSYEWIFLTGYACWLFFCLMNLTEWRSLFPIKDFRFYFTYLGYGMLALYLWEGRGRLAASRFLMAAGLMVIGILAAHFSETIMASAMVAWLIAAGGVDKRRLLKVFAAVTGAVLAITFLSILFGYLPNLIQEGESVRVRYRLGFTFTSYASHLILFLSLTLIAIYERLRWWGLVLLLGANYLAFRFTDTKTDMYLAIPLLILTFLVSACKMDHTISRMQVLIILIPVLLLLVSYGAQYFFDAGNETWAKADEILSSRIRLGHDMMMSTPHTLFGQKIKWVGANRGLRMTYNFVDNSYLHEGLELGVAYLLSMMGLYTYAMYRFVKKRRIMLIIAATGVMIHGLIDPQLISLTWHPFLLFGSLLFEEKEPSAGRNEMNRDHKTGQLAMQ